ncbi:hypothetical protein EON76_01255 [bacterium]|nr:MAG: hypothetical protein EON76_01255 [bacterium]
MKEMQYLVDIRASKAVVWGILWHDQTFRQWAGVIDPETYMVGELKQGSEVQFISAHGGYGVTSMVETLIDNEYLVLRHSADTQDEGAREREKEWTGGREVFLLTEKDGVTTLSVIFDVPLSMEAYFTLTYPKVLDVVKKLAENNT